MEKVYKINNQILDPSGLEKFKIGQGDMVIEKSGKINRDYTLLNPPLGHGRK